MYMYMYIYIYIYTWPWAKFCTSKQGETQATIASANGKFLKDTFI